MGWRCDRTRRTIVGSAVAGLLLAGTAACGAAAVGQGPASKPPAPAVSAAHQSMPKACAGLRVLPHPIPDPHPPGFLVAPEEFGTPSPGKPYLVVTLDRHNLRFSPGTVRYGNYNLCFVDRRPSDAGRDVAFTFFVSGPRIPMASVLAGTIGTAIFCPGAESWGVFLNDAPAPASFVPSNYGNLNVEPGTGCETVVT